MLFAWQIKLKPKQDSTNTEQNATLNTLFDERKKKKEEEDKEKDEQTLVAGTLSVFVFHFSTTLTHSVEYLIQTELCQ